MNGLRHVWRRRISGSRKGGPALEFALTTPAFIGVVLVAFEILYAIGARSVIDHSLEAASRNAVTGGETPSDLPARLSDFATDFYARTSAMIPSSSVVLTVTACASMETLNNDPSSCREADPGHAREVVRFAASYSHTFVAQRMVCGLLAMASCPPLTMNAQIVRRNEPF
jgi:Flp pilus assembly protein TadG